MRLVAACLIFAASPAFGHAMLEHADPAAGSIVSQAPATLSLRFSERLEPQFSRILVTDAHTVRVDKDDLHIAGDDARRVAIDLQRLQPGRYKVSWRAVSQDAHTTQGSFAFTVGK